MTREATFGEKVERIVINVLACINFNGCTTVLPEPDVILAVISKILNTVSGFDHSNY